MKPFEELESQNLQWVQTSTWKYDYELRDEDGAVVATLKRPGWWSSNAEVDAVGNRWRFERKLLWKTRITITSIGTGEEVGVYIPHWSGGGRLELADGRKFEWKSFSFWGSKWGWTVEDNVPVIGFQTGGFFKTNGEIKIDANMFSTKALPLLMFFWWYLVSLYQSDAAAW
jgi:hypothetical protein